MRILTLALFLVVGGCGSATDSDTHPEAEEDRETVFDPLVDSLDKAKAVESQVMQQKDLMDQAIAESEGSGDESEDDQDD